MRRKLFLITLGFLSALLTLEIFLSVWDYGREQETRKLNGIGEREEWLFAGPLMAPAVSRLAYQGPVGNPSEFLEPDPELGYRLRPNLQALPGRLRVGGRSIYDVRYSTGKNGWRIGASRPHAGAHVFFFGDSYTFGHGLNDSETLPERFAEAMKGNVQSDNFGVPGWGPQQALRLLELGREKGELGIGIPRKAFFLLIKEHLPRLAGLRAESSGSPRYELRNGKISFAGRFSDRGLGGRLCQLSALCEWVRSYGRQFPGFIEKLSVGSPAGDQLVALFQRMNEILLDRYRISLTVISWNVGDEVMNELEKSISASGVDLVRMKDAIPDFQQNSVAYVFPQDGHPNSRASELLAQYLAERLQR